MKSYIQIQCLVKGSDKLLFDRSIAECDLDTFDFSETIRALHRLFANCYVLINSNIPVSV